ncbi:hypothetical protein BDK51DRAFT_36938 [Blyttiomyces helicus]|uniref:GDS1 winged helix domain-containing protein n=1 Tax=Blyttiomyces helicus TaxID=388810 RepID=A0A4P9W615_9FUNG|nr:hypothetical protein BDK51DRAFT_36938 [Blyttiomyces helicus]|eukprot:RKO86358.1 hypothetical protein BDK51DRAFT_36938 [Blyttiomyces helicus]
MPAHSQHRVLSPPQPSPKPGSDSSLEPENESDNSEEFDDDSEEEGTPTFSLAIHPDDAEDKVFIAVVKALLMLGNRPSLPKELATFVNKEKLATLQ